ncbi:PREDICTED: uncharacterized protein LOC105359609 [Ceratosolen solmsi marchali]|uniref:Uncharacterized protein LOC105359609 n=1 Tax=Ceratosolen solmsi marchali TaxID=326594 RepID=A0AAJ6VLP3_9HYME|nr:PREDICTED: uncharacterized protein LOC105359609 [Ceratosolen solmsi marchali]
MHRVNNVDRIQQTSGKMIPIQPFLYANAREENSSAYLENSCKTEYNETTRQTLSILSNEELLPVRMTEASVYYSAAFRLDESNVCAEALEAILFDSLEGELILAEYQQNNFLCSTTQQKLTDVLLSRSAKSMTVAKHVQNYFVKLTNAIVKLMPNEDPNVYYVPPQSNGNDSKNPKGKLPDKWRNLTYQLRIRGILPRKKLKDKPTSSNDIPKTHTLKDDVDIHLKSLQVLREPLSQVILHWDATFDYRKLIRSTINSLDDVLIEWPILKTDIGPQLIESEFEKLFQYDDDLFGKWISFFNALYEIKKASIRDSIGKEYCNIFESLRNETPEVSSGIQIQLLPYLIPPITKIKTGSGIIVKPTICESSEGFVIYCKTSESIAQKVEFRSDRYKNWNVAVQPCIVLQGPQPHDIKSAYVSLHQQLWELDSPIRALDLAFKLYQVFNLHYPADCEQLWLVVQKIVYNITTPFDKKLTNVTSIANVLNVKLKCKKQRRN